MNAVAIVQARAGGTRLPGKVLMDVCGQPMILRQLARMERAKSLDDIVVAIPDGRRDDPLAVLCFKHEWAIFRGPEEDVLLRYLAAAEAADADIVVRVTADCPLIDPDVIDDTVRFYERGDFDFVANNIIPTFPHGLDLEVMSRGTLAIAEASATAPFDREHVTSWITRTSGGGAIFRIGNYAADPPLDHYRLTVDYPEDLAVIRAIYERFQGVEWFTTQQVLDFLSLRPDLVALNAKHRQPRMPAMGTA